LNIELRTHCELKEVHGEVGNFEVKLLQHPRYIDESKCVGCGSCAEECPKKVVDVFNAGLGKRKAVYLDYAQAVPLKYSINAEDCFYLTKGKCGKCATVCPAGAIDYEQQEKDLQLNVGAIILSLGAKPFDPKRYDKYKYTDIENVITSVEFERMLSASGPTQGNIQTLAKGNVKDPKKIAWLQCVGSRSQTRCDEAYCSSICCMSAIKEAVMAKEHEGDDLDCAIFYMDIRSHGKEFEKYYMNARNNSGIRFIRSRVHSITEDYSSKEVILQYVTERNEIIKEKFDLVIQSVGVQTSPETIALARQLGIELTEGNFAETSSFEPVATSRPGIFGCGTFLGPKDIPQTAVEASAAAAAAGECLAEARGTTVKKPDLPTPLTVKGKPPRIGVFVCRCGTNIAATIDVLDVAAYAATLPYVVYSTDNLYSCSQDSQTDLVSLIKDKQLTRVVVAACTPKTHELLFRETLANAGLNKYLFEMPNIRNHASWVHKNTPELATEKAKDLVRMSVAKAALMQPLDESELAINQTALIIGGGIAGLTAAKTLSRQGFKSHIIEKNPRRFGGAALYLNRTVRDEDIQKELGKLISDVQQDENIQVHLGSTVSKVEGFVGNFKTAISNDTNQQTMEIEHGVAIIATGAVESVPREYSFGQDDRIITSLDFDRMLNDYYVEFKNVKSVVFIQCVGSRDEQRPYCSRVCCSHSIANALELKRRNPDISVYVLNRDIRTYGEREFKYTAARKEGVIFLKYQPDDKPGVLIEEDCIKVTTRDHVLLNPLEIAADLLVLASAIVPPSNKKLAQLFKVPLNDDGFFVEKHAKLGPTEFSTDGVFLCGMAQYPKPIDEAVAQAKAAASRAITLLTQETMHTSGTVARTAPGDCCSCGTCVAVCPYSAVYFTPEDARMFGGKAEINPVLCKGCGLCVSSCRSGAIHLNGFDNDQIFAQISGIYD